MTLTLYSGDRYVGRLDVGVNEPPPAVWFGEREYRHDNGIYREVVETAAPATAKQAGERQGGCE